MQPAERLRNVINHYNSRFPSISDSEWSAKPEPGKWSKKEILGHLVDSALTNIRRFLVTQYRQNDRIRYEQDAWVILQGYQDMPIDELITLWTAINKQIARVMELMPADKLANTCDTGDNTQELHTLEFLVTDYIDHMEHHMEQIIL